MNGLLIHYKRAPNGGKYEYLAWASQSLLYKCFCYSDVHYSDPHCIYRMFWASGERERNNPVRKPENLKYESSKGKKENIGQRKESKKEKESMLTLESGYLPGSGGGVLGNKNLA